MIAPRQSHKRAHLLQPPPAPSFTSIAHGNFSRTTPLRDKWYADNCDLLKWCVLLTLTDRRPARHILQVLLPPNGRRPARTRSRADFFAGSSHSALRNVTTAAAIDASVSVEVVGRDLPKSRELASSRPGPNSQSTHDTRCRVPRSGYRS